MERLKFDHDGKLSSVDGELIKEDSNKKEYHGLQTSDKLEFLKNDENPMEDIFLKEFWSLYGQDGPLPPIKFSNGKTQEDVVKEIIQLAKNHKIILLHGTCGSGKSAIALNVAKVLGKASIVVPVKALQKQYQEDYIEKKFLRKQSGNKMKIAMITGRENHDSLYLPGTSCADPKLPENIKITEKNFVKIAKYVKENPFIRNTDIDELKNVKRITIAPANPYWSPILPSDYEIRNLPDSKRLKYQGANGRKYTFYHRKRGCSYYDQFLSYLTADAIVFNSAKYKSEISIGRKPLTEVDIIDEADEFLDSFFQQESLNLTRLSSALSKIIPDSTKALNSIEKIRKLISFEVKNKNALGVDENKIFKLLETNIEQILREFLVNSELEAEIAIEDQNYANKALESARNFEGSFDDVYLSYRIDDEENLHVKLVSTNLSGKFEDLLSKTKTLILMSGTLHSKEIMENIFKIKDYAVVEAENLNFGSIEITMSGKEFDCNYKNLTGNGANRQRYLVALDSCVQKAKRPSLVHVHSFRDLPDDNEKLRYSLGTLITSNSLKRLQDQDKTGSALSRFKSGFNDILFSTKCNRGADFPGDTCNSIIFTKYPNPNVSDIFWKVLRNTHPNYYWTFYKDKAWREFLQRIYRALRSPDDHVFVLSPDVRVLDSVRKLQNGYS